MNSSHEPHPPEIEWTWRDAKGVDWRVRPSRTRLALDTDGDAFTIDRADWDSRINYNPIAGGVVFRFDSGTREVGFLVTESQAQQLLEALQWSNTHVVASADRVVQAGERKHSWQTMTPIAIVALSLAVWAFLPFVGAVVGTAALVCMVIAWRQSAGRQRLRHVRPLIVATAALLVIALTACALGTYVVLRATSSAASSPSPALVPTISSGSKVLAVLIVLLALSVHECSHAVVAWWCGDTGPLSRGRVTLNPFAHIDPLGTVLVPAVLAYAGNMIFGWARPVMVTLHGVPHPKRANILISAAGPFSNLILGLVFMSMYIILGCLLKLLAPQAHVANFSVVYFDVVITGMASANVIAHVLIFLKWGFYINILLCFFNLIPIPPLDGGHVLGSLFPRVVGNFYRKLGPFTLIIFLSLIISGVLELLLLPAEFLIRFGYYLAGVVTQL